MNSKTHFPKISDSATPQSHFPQFSSDIFYLLSGYAKLSFCLFILPFYPVRNVAGGELEFRRYLPHQLACFAMHFSSMFFGITTFRSMLKETTFIGSIAIYELMIVIMVNVGCLISIIKCWWMKPNPYRKLLQVTYKIIDKNAKSARRVNFYEYSVIVASCLQIIINANTEIMTYFNSSNVNYTSSTSLRVFYSAQAIYFQTLFHVNVIIPNLLAMCCMFMIGKSFGKAASIQYSFLASNFSKRDHLNSLERLMDYFLQAKYLTDIMNIALGKLVLVEFFSVLPTLGFGLACILSKVEVHWEESIRTIHILVFFYLFILLSATGVSQVTRFPEIAYEKLWRNRKLDYSISEQLAKVSEMMVFVKAANVGFGGHPFFVIDYKYIGAVTGALVTYTVVMLQFRDSK